MSTAIDLSKTFIHLDRDGGAAPVEVTRSLFAGGSASRYHRLLGAFDFRSARDLHSATQEVHPEADEVVVVLSGALDVLLDEADGERAVALEAGEAAIVPRGVWHRLVMRRPGRLLSVNSRAGMESRRGPRARESPQRE